MLAWGAVAALALFSAQQTSADTILVVPGTSDPFLAGMPNGSACCFGDSAPAESPVYAGAVTGGATLTFINVTGATGYGPSVPQYGPNGDPGLLVDTLASEGVSTINNIAGYINAPVDALVGVFLNSSVPTSNPAPGVLDFSSPTSIPQLQQIFFIGNGSLGTITVPPGATRLFLGTVDGFGWYNNTGAFDVTVTGISTVPEPPTWVMILLGFGCLGAGITLNARKHITAAV
jgi:large repetitive protein